MTDRFVIESPSHLADVPSFYLSGLSPDDAVPHYRMDLEAAQRFPTREAAETFIRDKLPLAADRLRVKGLKRR